MSVHKSIASPARSRFVLAMMSALVMVAGMLFGANVAAADSVQVQSFQRASQTATCDSPPESMTEWRVSWANPSDPTSGPTWHPTWERWANSGNGGWTCTRSITWARTATSPRSSAVGDIGPGGGLIFLISGGLSYEMAPRNWYDPTNESADDPSLTWCAVVTDVPLADGTAVGTGAANTAAMAAAVGCNSGAAAAVLAYGGANASVGQWFLPSQDELNAMCNYSRNPSAPAAPSVPCDGGSATAQNDTFASSRYGFARDFYWSSSQYIPFSLYAFYQGRLFGNTAVEEKHKTLGVRPIRAF